MNTFINAFDGKSHSKATTKRRTEYPASGFQNKIGRMFYFHQHNNTRGTEKAGLSCTENLHLLQCSNPLKAPKTSNVRQF